MDVISFISDGFNIYFPIAILLLCTATYFRLGSRILHFLGFEQFIGDDDMTQEFTDEGKELVKRGRLYTVTLNHENVIFTTLQLLLMYCYFENTSLQCILFGEFVYISK